MAGKYRVIHYLCFSKGILINNFIEKELCASFDLMFQASVGAWLAKVNVKTTFLLLLNHLDAIICLIALVKGDVVWTSVYLWDAHFPEHISSH